jgi:3',5'-cyclic AMP phosphodiesterase CpdA
MKIIHLSDLHFGTHEQKIVDSLHHNIQNQNADLVIVSGDFTQIGSRAEFEQARTFLDALKIPFFCVPGNHDVPAWNLTERFLNPYKKYKRFITEDLNPFMTLNDNALIAGLNSARRALPHWNWANGAISGAQRKNLSRIVQQHSSPAWRICVLHHPIHKVQEMPIDVTVFGRKRTLACLENLKFDLVLTGHVHHASITLRGDQSHKTAYISASTALSSRTRGQENGFNVIELSDKLIEVGLYTLDGDQFVLAQNYQHMRTD